MNDPVVVSNPKRMLLALTALALTVLVFTLASVVKRVLFPYDLLAWSDDYVFNELLKLRLGAPLYGAYDAGNSFTYPPGGVLLHHALLAPLGLDLSLVANRVLGQLWLVLAVVLGVRLVSRISLGRFARPAESGPALVGCAAALLLAGYSNSLADSLHPATLELLVLTVAATLAAEWSRLPRLGRFGAVLLLPACALLVKQSGVSVALALAAVALTPVHVSRGERVACAVLSLLSAAATFTALLFATDGAFWNWGVALSWRRPFMPHHLAYLVAAAGAIGPLLVLIAKGVASALRDREPATAAWLRVALFPAAYLLVATPAFLRVGAGGFELGAIAFLAAILGLAQIKDALTGAARGLPRATVVMLGALQLVLWLPFREPPGEFDAALAADACAHVREALACGERVLVDLGTACLAERPPRAVPRDRLASLMDLTWSGLPNAIGLGARLAREDYDMLAIHVLPLPWPWSRAATDALQAHYVVYAMLPPANPPNSNIDLHDQAHFDDRQGIEFGMALFERKRDAGRHRAVIKGAPQCTRMDVSRGALR